MPWELNGNSDVTTTSFLGPTNTQSPQPLVVKTTPSTAGATPLERLRVTSEGRVGIGIINPSAKLTVAGGGALINNVAIGTDGLSELDYPNEQDTIGLASPGTSALLRLQSPNGLAFHTGAPGASAADNLRMTITPSGAVGVGKAPGANYKLDVAGTVNAADYHKNGSPLVSSQWADVSGGINYAGGNVGIGTADLQYGRLTIEDTGVPLSLRETGQEPAAGGLWRMPLDAGILRFDVNTAAAGDFSTYLTPLAMAPDGHVGIGKAPAASTYKLDVAGLINATDYHRDGSPLIAAGRTPPGLDWQQYGDSGVFIDVNTEGYHFTTTPVYVTALHGSSYHWATTGGSSLYDTTPTGFRVYIRWSDGKPLTVSDAQRSGWHIEWIATETS